MKHHNLVTRVQPLAMPLDGQTSFEVKVDFVVKLVDRTITWIFQKDSAL